MRLPLTFAMLAAAALLLTGAGLAGHCSTWSTSSTASVNGFYVHSHLCQPGCLFDFVVYKESNGISGLQRADSVVDNTCHGLIVGDTREF